jgi:hypothetical protein
MNFDIYYTLHYVTLLDIVHVIEKYADAENKSNNSLCDRGLEQNSRPN